MYRRWIRFSFYFPSRFSANKKLFFLPVHRKEIVLRQCLIECIRINQRIKSKSFLVAISLQLLLHLIDLFHILNLHKLNLNFFEFNARFKRIDLIIWFVSSGFFVVDIEFQSRHSRTKVVLILAVSARFLCVVSSSIIYSNNRVILSLFLDPLRLRFDRPSLVLPFLRSSPTFYFLLSSSLFFFGWHISFCLVQFLSFCFHALFSIGKYSSDGPRLITYFVVVCRTKNKSNFFLFDLFSVRRIKNSREKEEENNQVVAEWSEFKESFDGNHEEVEVKLKVTVNLRLTHAFRSPFFVFVCARRQSIYWPLLNIAYFIESKISFSVLFQQKRAKRLYSEVYLNKTVQHNKSNNKFQSHKNS